MKKFLIAGIAAAAFVSAPALAADYPVKGPMAPVWNWTGFYLGVNAGVARYKTDWFNNIGVTSGEFNGAGAVAGGTVGWNWQAAGSPWVFGVEGDWDWADVKAKSFAGSCTFECVAKVSEVATARGRLGFAALGTPLMFYATGGWAWGQFKPSFVPAVAGINNYHDSGYTFGGGVEGMLGHGWTAKAEYLYVDFGNSPVFFPATAIFSTPNRMNIFRFGLNYKFGG